MKRYLCVDYVAISIDFPRPDCLLPKASKPSALLFKRKIHAFPNEERNWAWLDSSISCAENHCTTWTAFFSIYFPKKCWQIWIQSIMYKKFFFCFFLLQVFLHIDWTITFFPSLRKPNCQTSEGLLRKTLLPITVRVVEKFFVYF